MKLDFAIIRLDAGDVIATGAPAPEAGSSNYYTSTVAQWNQAFDDGKVDFNVGANDVLLLLTFTNAETVDSMVQFASNQPFPNGRYYAWYNGGSWWTENKTFSSYDGNLPD